MSTPKYTILLATGYANVWQTWLLAREFVFVVVKRCIVCNQNSPEKALRCGVCGSATFVVHPRVHGWTAIADAKGYVAQLAGL